MVGISMGVYSQKVKSKEIVTKYIDLPDLDVNAVNVAELNIEFAAAEVQVGQEKLKDTKYVCVPEGGGLKEAIEVDVYYYAIPYTSPASVLCATDPNGKVVFSKKISDPLKKVEKYGYQKCEFWQTSALKSKFSGSKSSIISKIKSKEGNALYKKAQTVLTGSFYNPGKDVDGDGDLDGGFTTYAAALLPISIEETFELHYAKGPKTLDYSDLDQAYELSAGAYKTISKKGPNAESNQQLKEALPLWEKALTETNLEDKKARINTKVAQAIHKNMSIANMFLYNNAEALKHAAKANELAGNFTNNTVAAWRKFIPTLKRRASAGEKNKDLIASSDKLISAVEASKSVKLSVKKLGADQYQGLYNKLVGSGRAVAKEEYEEAKNQEKEAIASGKLNPYQKYVGNNPTQGNTLFITAMVTKLTEFPDEICDLTELNMISITYNGVAKISDKIGQLTELKSLNLATNKIESVPASIGKLVKLEKLNLSKNPITTLPDEIGNLQNLQSLNLKGTKISAEDQTRIAGLLPNCKVKF